MYSSDFEIASTLLSERVSNRWLKAIRQKITVSTDKKEKKILYLPVCG